MPSVPLRNYQHAAIYETAAAHGRYAFYYDTGVGKTRVGAGIIATYPGRWCVVTPRSVFPAWFDELERWGVPCWTPVCHYHKKQWRQKVSPEPNGGVLLVTPQTLALDRHWKHLRPYIGALVVDESSVLCNPKAKITRRLWGIRNSLERVYLLSGSPSPQGPLWLWGQAELLGVHVGGWWRWANEFGTQIQIPGRKGGPWRLRPGAEARILRVLAPVAEYVKKDEVLSLADPQVIDRVFASQAKTPTWEQFVEEYAKKGHIMLRREIASGFAYTVAEGGEVEAIWGNPARIEAGLELVAELDGRNVVLWVQFRATMARLLEELPALGCEVYTDPQAFISGSGWRVLVSHPRSAGYGTDGLQHVASDMVFVEGSFSYDEYYQSLSRLHRSGQAHPVCIYRLRAAGSDVEDAMWGAVERKMTFAQALQEALRAREVKACTE